MSKSWKHHSRSEWRTGYESDDRCPSIEKLQIGCLQRIADATEAIAKSQDQLRQCAEQVEGTLKDIQGGKDGIRQVDLAPILMKRLSRSPFDRVRQQVMDADPQALTMSERLYFAIHFIFQAQPRG